MACCSGSNFVPVPDAALVPDQHVNFTFGMVLGVDDFRQEHTYLAARDERLLRLKKMAHLSELDRQARKK